MSDNTMVDISDLPPSVVFAALYNNAVILGYESRTPLDGFMSITAANAILNDRSSASFIEEYRGRFIGVDFTKSEFDPRAYNAANPNGMTAEQVVAHVRKVLTTEMFAEATKDFWKVQTP